MMLCLLARQRARDRPPLLRTQVAVEVTSIDETLRPPRALARREVISTCSRAASTRSDREKFLPIIEPGVASPELAGTRTRLGSSYMLMIPIRLWRLCQAR